jgi:regulator of replication initiation timing
MIQQHQIAYPKPLLQLCFGHSYVVQTEFAVLNRRYRDMQKPLNHLIFIPVDENTDLKTENTTLKNQYNVKTMEETQNVNTPFYSLKNDILPHSTIITKYSTQLLRQTLKSRLNYLWV